MSELSLEEALPEGAYAELGEGVRMHYHLVESEVEPEGEAKGPPLLFLHGSGPGASGWSNFRANATFLATHGHRSVLLDSLGYGRSDKPTDRPYTLEVMAGAALGVMDQLGIDRFIPVGNSQGGAQAIYLALHHPERVPKLVLMAPGGLERREVYMEMRGIRSMLRCIYGPEGITLEGMRKVFEKQVVDPSVMPEGVIERRYAIAKSQPRHVFESMRVDNQEERLSEIACPTLGFWGASDLFCPLSGAAKLAERIPDCRVILSSRTGHWVMVERAELFNRSVASFLEEG